MRYLDSLIIGVIAILFLGFFIYGRNSETLKVILFLIMWLAFLVLPVVIVNFIFRKKPGFKLVLINLILCLFLGLYFIIQSTRDVPLIESIQSFGRIIYLSIFLTVPYLLPFMFSQIFLRKNPDLKFNSNGKGLFFGSLVGIAFYIIDGLIYQNFFYDAGSEDVRILGNFIFGSLMGLGLLTGSIFWVTSKFREKPIQSYKLN